MRRSRPPSLFAVLLTTLLLVPVGLPGTVQNVSAQSDTARWTPELAVQYDQITDTEISPDGQLVAYVVREAVMDRTTSTFYYHIHVVSIDGSSDVQYTRGQHSNWSPQWSPSGDRIAFLSTRGEGPPQVYVMRFRGGEAYAVTDAETGVSRFQWGPDGKRIAYTMTDPKSKAEIRREKEKRDVTLVNHEFRYDHLYTTEVKPARDTTRQVRRLTEGGFHVEDFDWAPDGGTIAFAHQPNPGRNSRMGRDLSTVPADSGTVHSLVERPGIDAGPRYSPGGEQVAFASMGGERVWEHRYDIYTVSADGGEPAALTRTPDRLAFPVHWTTGGEAVLVSEGRNTSWHVYAVPARGSPVREVTSGAGLYEAFSYSRSADRLAFVYENSESPQEVYVSGREDFSRRKVTAVNSGKPKPEMGRTEILTWTAPDGTEIEGLLTYPVGYEGGRVPLILDVHGGPFAVHSRHFTGDPYPFPRSTIHAVQVSAQRGYAVLRPNPRGSAGYGRSFRAAVLENFGPGPFRDLMAGVDRTVEMGLAHPDSLAIMGWSYGGYMTAYAVTQTDRFEAASMLAGTANLISDVGTRDNPDWAVAHMGGEFWNQLETYEENSPIYHVKGATTPTLVLHGVDDDPSQSREFYRALRRQGVPTELVIYPRMGHGPSEPKQWIDVTTRTLDWFDEHLGRASSGS